MKEERERRNDFGKIRVGQRDLVGMDFVASMGVVRLDALASLFTIVDGKDVSLEATRKVVQRWVQVGWATQQSILKGEPPFVWLTKNGMAQTRFNLPTDSPGLALLKHTSDLSFIRLDALRSNPSAYWRSEREIRKVASVHTKGNNFPHIPDAEVILNENHIVAIERERTAKTVERTRNIMMALCSRKFDYNVSENMPDKNQDFRYLEIFYYASPETLGVVDKAKNQLPENFSKRVRVLTW